MRIHADASAAGRAAKRAAAAYTRGEHIHFAAGMYQPESRFGQELLAHELGHVLQQRQEPHVRPGTAASAEAEARTAASRVLGGNSVKISEAYAGDQLQGSPLDQRDVEQARSRLELLGRFVDEWETREARRIHVGLERDPLLLARTALDRAAGSSGADLAEAAIPGGRERTERATIAQLNRRPLRISVTEDAVTITARFHVRFEAAAMRNRARELEASLQQGVDLVWNQRLRGDALGGRQLRFVAETTLIAANDPRDQNYWLITVRPNDTAPIAHPGCSLPTDSSGVPTSATDPACDGGAVYERVAKKVKEQFAHVPEELRLKRVELNRAETRVHNFVEFVASGRATPALADALAQAEAQVKTLTADVASMESAKGHAFTPPPRTWIVDRIQKLNELLSQRTEQSALALRRLTGPVTLNPEKPDVGRPTFG